MLVNLKTGFYLASLCVLCIGSPVTTNCEDTSLGYKYDTEVKRCYKFHTHAKVYADAVVACRREGASLAVPNDWFDNMILMAQLIEHPENTIQNATISGIMTVGVHRGPSDAWLTVDGKVPRHTNWMKNYPKHGEDFAYMTRTGYWVSSQSHLVPFICQKPA